MTASDSDLVERQNALQREARQVLSELGLIERLEGAGRVVVVGSAALGLMVWRDIDIEIYCPEPSSALTFETMRGLVEVPGVYRMRFHDYHGPRSIADVPDGYYWGVHYQPEGRQEWKLDCWFVREGTTHRMGGDLLATLPAKLTPETRATILRLKTLWFEHPSYRQTVYSIDIYDAVLEHGITAPEQLERYLRERGKLG